MKRAIALATRPDAAPAHAEGLRRLADSRFPLDWNGPVDRPYVRFREEDLDKPITDHLETVVRRQPDRIAILDGTDTLTYADLWRGVSGLAETIEGRTKPGEAVGILLPACAMAPLAMLACLAAGRPFIVLDPHYPADWLAKVLEDACPALVIGRRDTLVCVESPAAGVISLDALPLPAATAWRPAVVSVDDPACILFTSGSTGRPKGIVNSQRNLLQRVAQSINAGHINPSDRFLTLASLCTIVGVRDVMTALLSGASIRLVDPQRTGARDVMNLILQDAVTILFAFPALLRSLMASGTEPAAGSVRLVRVGGDTLLWSDIDQIRARFGAEARVQLIYAATEAPMMQWFVEESIRGSEARVPIGYPLAGNYLAILDEHGRPVPPGEFGELVAESRYVSLGLWADGRCKPHSVEHGLASGTRVFRSGDLVRQRADGLLERAGRIDRQVKIRGSRVDLDGVEAILRGQPFVEDVGAVAREAGPDGAHMIVAYVSLRAGAPAGVLDDIEADLCSAPSAMRPTRIYVVPEIPRLPSSKLDNRALLALDEARMADERAAAISDAENVDPVSLTVAQIWHELLKAPVSGADDDFFECGGDSLQAIAFTLAVEQALGLELPVTLINEAPSFGAFCDAVRQGHSARYVPLVLLKPGDTLPPVFLIHGVGGNVTEMLPMARRMTYAGPVYGIQARGLTGDDAPHNSVAAMAADYLREVRLRQPKGPYFLCGYSFGGLVAVEIAKLLEIEGEQVGFIGLFDTLMSPLKWPMSSWISILGRKGCKLLTGKRQAVSPIRTARVLKVSSSALLTSAKHQPGFYPGVLTLFAPAEREPGIPASEYMWRKHARSLVVIPTPGAHATMLSGDNAGITAARLTQALTRAMVEEPDVHGSAESM